MLVVMVMDTASNGDNDMLIHVVTGAGGWQYGANQYMQPAPVPPTVFYSAQYPPYPSYDHSLNGVAVW